MGVFVIAEAACTWRYGDELATAKRSIAAAKAAGADAWKTQWCGDLATMYARRKHDPAGKRYDRLAWPREWHEGFRLMCDKAGIEYMCTQFIPQDADVIASYCKTGKISAFESQDQELISVCRARFHEVIISFNHGQPLIHASDVKKLYCVSQYPTPLNELHVSRIADLYNPNPGVPILAHKYHGLSDHTTSTLTGAVAVGCGARIIEKHVRLSDTPTTDPDWPHSLVVDSSYIAAWDVTLHNWSQFHQYVQNIREAERML
jgi:N,N'-diacetyllegionaminate synthase